MMTDLYLRHVDRAALIAALAALAWAHQPLRRAVHVFCRT